MKNEKGVVELITAGQQALRISDADFAQAVGYDVTVVKMIKAGAMRLPINKVSAFADVLRLEKTALLRALLLESSPSLWEVLKACLPLGDLSDAEVNLVRHIRKLSGGRQSVPVVLDGASVIAVVVSQ